MQHDPGKASGFLENGSKIDLINPDFSKTFHMILCGKLLVNKDKLIKEWINEIILDYIEKQIFQSGDAGNGAFRSVLWTVINSGFALSCAKEKFRFTTLGCIFHK